MVLKAIIEEILDDGIRARVRIPRYNRMEGTTSATPFEELYVATICSTPGSSPALVVGDIVFVSFEDGEIDQPVIVGMLFRQEMKSSSLNISASSLNVDVNCSLPHDTTIGNVSKEQLSYLEGATDNIQGQIDILFEKIRRLEEGV